MECSKCNQEIKDKECVYCSICFINQMWEIEKLQKIKVIIDEIIKLHELYPKANKYNKNDYEDLL
jgi:hypothetical protein